MRKPPCRLDEVLERLGAVLSGMKLDGEVFIPSERILCDLVGTSRMTIRKALDELESQGKIETGARGRVLAAKRVAIKPKGKVLFISSGHEWITLHAWNRLWARLNSILKPDGYDMNIKLYSESSAFSAAELKGYDFIILTDIQSHLRNAFADHLTGREGVISSYEGFADIAKHVVALDNDAAGRMGAELLLGSGYKRPALFHCGQNYVGFQKRRAGFLDVCRSAKFDAPPREFQLASLSLSAYARDLIAASDALIKTDCDSVFVTSDEVIGLAYDTFARCYAIPAEFGLATFAGVHEGLMHHPTITTVGHGTAQVAQAMHKLMEDIRLGKARAEGVRILVKPNVHAGATLRNEN
ncbi:MAG: GntR family transcriptional regulator [Lentisphaeria bacterium]